MTETTLSALPSPSKQTHTPQGLPKDTDSLLSKTASLITF
ncbi:hypothetical protein cje140_08930 [Campylobacter jejuni subsp. jejuni LMG 9217]|nr:hypothetical protein cje140_08930 [Campylobacter jejuni subsp. jejuni LMG 9217]